MPVHHFLVTFTVPRELGLVLRSAKTTAIAVCSTVPRAFAMLAQRPSHCKVANWASLVCCTLGDAICKPIILIFTMSFPAAG